MKKTTLRQVALKLAFVAFVLLAPLGLRAQETLTVYDGTSTNEYVPFYGYYMDSPGTTSEFIIPEDELSDMVGGTISKVTFYISGTHQSWGSPVVQVYLGEAASTTLSSANGPTNFTVVYTGTVSNQSSTIEIEFNEPYTYEGGNLLIGTYVETGGSYKHTFFYGVSAPSGSSYYLYSWDSDPQSFLPKTTFTYEPAQQGGDVCDKPETFVASNVTGSSATLTWTGGSGTYNVELKGGAYSDWTAVLSNTNLTTTQLTLQATTSYQARVQSVCDGTTPTSGWKNVSFNTPCDSYDIPYTYGFEEAAQFDCWTPIAGVTRANSSYNTHAGSYYLRFSGTTSNLVALPQFNEATNNLRVEFWTRPEDYTYSSCGTFSVGYMTDITDASTFVEVANYAYNEWTNNTYVKKTVDFNNAPANANIAFRHNAGSSSYYWYADDVTVMEIPSCVAPTGLAATPSTTSAELSWTANSGETAWTIYYKKATDEDYTEVANATNPYTLDGLTPASNYQFYVVANCSANEASEPSEVFPFATACDAVTTFPWSENFENYTAGNFNAPCWVNEHISGDGSQIFKVYTSTSGNNTTHRLQLPDMYNGTMTKLRLPEMTLSTGDSYLFSIDVNRVNATSYTGEGIRVYASTDGEIEGATELAFISRDFGTGDGNLIPAESAAGWYTYELPIPFTGTCYIVLRGESKYGSSTYMDNFMVKKVLPCVKPSAPTFVSSTTTSATLSWTNGAEGQTAWQIAYSTNPNFNPDEVTPVDVTSNPGTINSLNASTTYYAYVRASCGDLGYSEWSTAYCQFATECDVISAVGYSENFDATTASSASSPSAITLPNCWNFINTCTYSSYKYYPAVSSYSSSSYAHSGTNYLRFYSYGYSYYDPQPQYAILPERSGLAGKLVTLWAKGYNTSSTYKIGTMTDPTDASTFTQIAEQALTTSYQEFEHIIPTDAPGNYLAIMMDAASDYNYRGVYIDDIQITEVPTCRKPSALTCDSKTAHTATLSWNNGEEGQNAWQIAYSTDANFDPNSVTPIDVTTNPATIEGLAQNTTYYAYVRANCGGGDYSAWNTTKATFNTPAGNVTPSGLSVSPASITSSQATASWNAVAGNTQHQSYDIYWAVSTTEAPVTAVPAEPAAPNLISGITATSQVITGLAAETQYRVWVRDNCGDENNGGDGYSAWSSYFTFTTASACQTPDGLAASNVTNNSATINWNTYGQTSFKLQYRVNGAEWDDNNIITNVNTPYILSLPLGNTTYQVRVQATCADAETWSNPLNFTTACDPENFPWSENFDTWTTKSVCWSFRSGQYNMGAGPATATTSSSAWPPNTDYGSYITIDGKALTMNIYSSNRFWAVTPDINITTDDAVLKVDVAVAAWSSATPNYDDNDTLAFAISTDGGATFTNLRVLDGDDLNDLGNDYTTIYVPVAGYNGQSVRFAIYGGSISGTSPYDNRCVIDNVSVEESPSCFPVGTLAAATNVTATSADLSWTLVDNTQNAWQIDTGDVDHLIDVNLTEATKNDNTVNYTINILHPSTVYTVKVRANCGTDPGEWSNPIAIETPIACPAPTNLELDGKTTETLTVTWTEGTEGDNSWTVCYKAESEEEFHCDNEVDQNPYTIEGLTQGTNYTVKVMTNCANGYPSPEISEVFQTEANCPKPENLKVTDGSETAHGATITWDGNSENDSYTIEYRQAIVSAVDVNITYDFEDGTMQGWTTISNDADNNAWSIKSGSYDAHNSSYFVRSTYTSSGYGIPNDWLISPEIQLGGMFSFYAKRYSTSSTDQFQVYVSTTGNNISDFQPISEVITPTASYELYQYDLSSYSGNGYVAIVYTGLNDQYYVYVDDINYTLHVDAEYDSWQEIENISGTSYTFGTETVSLTPETNYQVRVKANCGDNESPYCDNIVGFTTDIACHAPTALTYDGLTHNSVALTWTENGSATNWQICVNDDETNLIDLNEDDVTINGDDITFNMLNLLWETHYSVKVRANCVGEDPSSWSIPEEFTTLEACAAPTAFVLGDVEAHQATFSWTAGNGNEAWKVYVKKHADAEYPTEYTSATTATATINELYAATVYDVKIVPDCDEAKVLEKTNAFATECEAVTTFPWSENFEGFTANTVPTCWDNSASTSYINSSTSSPNCIWGVVTVSGNNMIKMENYWAQTGTALINTPSIEIPTSGVYALSFDYAHNATCGNFTVKVSTDNGANFTDLDSYSIGSGSSHTEPGDFTPATISLADYAGVSIILQFFASANYGDGAIFVDNIKIDLVHTITATANPTAGGTITGAGDYTHGATATLTATANEGYAFVNWTLNDEVVSNIATYTISSVSADGNYVAHFVPTYVITAIANPDAGGTVEGAGTYNQGSNATLTATANVGYAFVNWTLNDEVVSNIATYTISSVSADGNYVAHFVPTYVINATANPADGGTITGAGDYTHGATATLTADANDGYRFVNWTKGGTEVSTDAEYSFTVTEAGDYVANFASDIHSKDIEANKWYAISSPVHNSGDNETLAGVNNLTSGTYDLYGYNEATGSWNKPSTVLEQGKGYIYRRSSNTTLNFVGINNSSVPAYTLSYACDDDDLKGFNLVGNPYPQPATPGMVCYSLKPEGIWYAQPATYQVPVCEAVLVYTDGSNTTVSFSAPTPSKSSSDHAALAFTVSNDEFEDVAYARFDNGEGLPKIGHLNSEAPMLSIPVEGRRYAIANLGSDCESFDMVLRAAAGTYTLSFNGNTGYCHLIDRVTGKDIDLLRQSSYTFTTTGSNATRFMVKLSPNAAETDNSSFVYWNGSAWVVEGNGTLQVFDVLGRKVFSKEVNTEVTIPTSQFPGTGVYIIRLGEKSKKIVVK